MKEMTKQHKQQLVLAFALGMVALFMINQVRKA